MNKVLFTYLSTLPKNREVISYEVESGKSVRTDYTNLAALNYLKEKNIKIDKIFAVCSSDVNRLTSETFGKTAKDYFCDEAKKLYPDVRIISISNSDLDDVLCVFEHTKDIEKTTDIVLDITGGFRDAIFTLTLISRFMEFKGLNVEEVLYARKTGISSGKIESYKNKFRLLTLINGVSEFVNFGSSVTLSKYFEDTSSIYVEQLINTMENISDCIVLGKTGKLLNFIEDLRIHINEYKNNHHKNADEIILNELIPIIEQKMFVSGKVDVLSIIRWCIDNNFIQQALTLYVEKIPEYMFDNGFIIYKGDVNKVNAIGDNVYAHLFYSEFMKPHKSEIDELKAAALEICLNRGKIISNKYEKNESIAKGIKAFKEIYNVVGNDNLKNYKSMDMSKKLSDRSLKAWNIIKGMNNYKTLADVNSNDFFMWLLGYRVNKDTVLSKIEFLKNFSELSEQRKNEFEIKVDKEAMKRISMGYVFFKALRNEINHASDDENINEGNKKIFDENGFKYCMKTRELKDQIKGEIDFIRGLSGGNEE